MGAEKEVRVLLEPRQKGIQHRRQGLSREGGPMEAVGAVRNRAKAKHREACESVGKPAPSGEAPNLSVGCMYG
jgi:hypothetical protein